ncbi:Na,H/K antiporter P-type ATPase, alpha subunit [Spizellomyces punctatus DAOM BR117]|uniref:Na,H/K antiporter P-type ATPase, alpha subunit n=1 Tax=Spizellomyces punctatus (strain DAOM BR117) TaxID=645134 RepID=A0A0L0HSY3_SPIPD|nr:Na,H/K antiporter P-type ATPase, alpha subunit [Spizellomyces punctatus DAOM BR117]KND04182.1 Na,H/K antiporter P-type ATPase, alpha subunit [Spizellomyces punctatus DAOM BR117]|eukprot:XP_016612221.1 Na,H/K antiporter P-type ATPase, alpha subunit [Spizellomyces punctatus DAOM BR117]
MESTGATDKKTKKVDLNEHLLSFEEIQKLHKTSFDARKPVASAGLTPTEVTQRQAEHGPNILTPPKQKSLLLLYLECLANLFNLLLLIAGVFTYILYGIDPVGNYLNLYVGAILLGVALLNAFIEFYQLQKSAAILRSFMNMVPMKGHAIRGSALVDLPAAELVVGDIVFVRQGDKIPADIYVFHSSELKVDNSSLTGESDPQERTAHNTHKNPLEATNLAFSGTLAISGECYGVVIRIGDKTVLGQIAGLTQNEKKRPSPLSREIDDFVSIIATIAFISALIFFIVIMIKDKKINTAFNFAIGVLTAWVPQGLPATMTMLLTIAAKRMAARNVLVKDLRGVETLGAITLLATDKTGTLTKNRMTVASIWTSLRILSADPHATNLEAEEGAFDQSISGVNEMLHLSAMCTRARFDRADVPVPERNINGDATESGLLRWSAQQLSDIDQLSAKYPKVFEVPFNSDNKWALTIHRKQHANGVFTLYLKGAPERVLKMCSVILVNGKDVPLTSEHEQAFLKTYQWMAGKGRRVLAFAQLQMPAEKYPENIEFSKEKENYPTRDLCFMGLISLEDPPKHGVREAIGRCREAGIKVMMVTGDHPLTAEAIGRKINLMLGHTKETLAKKTGRPIETIQEHEYSSIVIHGETIDDLTDSDWDKILMKEEIIFARTSPKHKLEIVSRAQNLGHIVGVTGDGVNDSPALKKADLGIAMNISGSDVSKEAASMILLDDNFASIVGGIAEGRLIFANLKKSIQYTLTHIIPEVVPFLLYAVVPLPIMLATLQILVVDLGFELFAALCFAWEPPESKEGLMKLPPRQPVTEESIVRRRQYQAEDLQHGGGSSEDLSELGFFEKLSKFVRAPFTLYYWKRKTRPANGEVLVDAGVLSWAYIEAAILETGGCILAFFVVLYNAKSAATGEPFRLTPYDAYNLQNNGGFVTGASDYITQSGHVLNADDQLDALAQGQSAFYFCLMINQMWNLFACKFKYRMPFGIYVFKNRYTFLSVLSGSAFTAFIVYAPPLNTGFGTSYHLSPIYWLIGMASGALIVAYSAVRKLLLRHFFPVTWNPAIEGLNMHPTRWSMIQG